MNASEEDLRRQLLLLLPTGHEIPMPARELALLLDTSPRMIATLVSGLVVDEGYLIGSTCKAGSHGYFLCHTPEDVEVGTRHLRARATGIWVRIAALQRAARRVFGDGHEVLRLFEFDDEDY